MQQQFQRWVERIELISDFSDASAKIEFEERFGTLVIRVEGNKNGNTTGKKQEISDK